MSAMLESIKNRVPFRLVIITTGLVALVVLLVRHRLLIKYAGTYAVQLYSFAMVDEQRQEGANELVGEAEKSLLRKRVAWLTAMVNDDFVVPSIALAYLLRKLSCYQEMIAMVTSGVSKAGQTALKKAGYIVKIVEPMDCDYMEKRKGRQPTGRGILGTHTRLQAWNLTTYSKLVYMDSDFMPLTNMDELFSKGDGITAGYCSRPTLPLKDLLSFANEQGVVDPCFNAGLIVFKPSMEIFNGLMKMWSDLSDYVCPNDQVLLWHYYGDHGNWEPLPYAYNVRRVIYYPMKGYHFACCRNPKPWHLPIFPSREDANRFSGPIKKVEMFATLWWRHFYAAIDDFHLEEWWSRVRSTLPGGRNQHR